MHCQDAHTFGQRDCESITRDIPMMPLPPRNRLGGIVSRCYGNDSSDWSVINVHRHRGVTLRSIKDVSHVTAGFGDVGFCGFWTLEMFAVQPVRVYPGVPICQIFYHDIRGAVTEYSSSKYQDNQDIQPSLLFKEWREEVDPQKRLAFGQEMSE